ncbi:hypothetical protein [Tessaracoccus sp. O5.2]|uniref:hypothetical protein n=1 Tax=Tessaracoccus sp. O5.2 TaxID=3157622 RepID=UPI0036DF3E16
MRSTRASLEADAEADALPFAEVAPDGGAVRASLEADANPIAEVAPRCAAPGRVSKPTPSRSLRSRPVRSTRASLEADAVGVDLPRPIH